MCMECQALAPTLIATLLLTLSSNIIYYPSPNLSFILTCAAGKKGGLDIATECSEAEGTLQASLTLPLGTPKLLMSEIAQQVAADTMLRATPGEPLFQDICMRAWSVTDN